MCRHVVFPRAKNHGGKVRGQHVAPQVLCCGVFQGYRERTGLKCERIEDVWVEYWRWRIDVLNVMMMARLSYLML